MSEALTTLAKKGEEPEAALARTETALARAVIGSVEFGTDRAAAKILSLIDPQLPAPGRYAKQE